MSALAGLWRFDGAEARPGVGRMLASQAMYGGHRRDWGDGPIALGRDLRRLLPEDARDFGPQVGGDGSMVLVADVRLDNRDELAAALGLGPIGEQPDSALVLRCLEAWGEDAIARLMGDFALALWDSRRRSLLLARDALGMRPLHLHRGRDFIAFASMPKGLHALPEVPRAPDRDAVAAFLALMPETGGDTFFAGIDKVLPGHVMTIDQAGVRSRRYWTAPATELRLRDPRDYEEALRAEFDRAVAVRLRGAGDTVGSHLSAGLDSSAVTATAARALAPDRRVIAYTAVPEPGHAPPPAHSFADEWPLASLVAGAHPNVEHVRIAASGQSPVARLDQYFHLFDRPMLNLCNGVWITAILDDMRARKVPVLLTGQSGNMSISFDGMAVLPRMLRRGQWLELARTVAALLRGGSRLGTVGAQIIGPFLPAALWRAITRLRGKEMALGEYSLLHPALHEAMDRRGRARGLDVHYRPRADPHELRRWVLGRVDHGNYNKGFLGGWGVDVRDPTADRRLIELCLAIPAEQFLAGGVPRSLARRAFADRLPAALLGERRKGYQAADWHHGLDGARAEVAEEVERGLATPGLGDLIAADAMRRMIAEWPADWSGAETSTRYRLGLLRGLSAAHFIRKADGSNV